MLVLRVRSMTLNKMMKMKGGITRHTYSNSTCNFVCLEDIIEFVYPLSLELIQPWFDSLHNSLIDGFYHSIGL